MAKGISAFYPSRGHIAVAEIEPGKHVTESISVYFACCCPCIAWACYRAYVEFSHQIQVAGIDLYCRICPLNILLHCVYACTVQRFTIHQRTSI